MEMLQGISLCGYLLRGFIFSAGVEGVLARQALHHLGHTSYVAILNKTVIFFFLLQNQRAVE
jgi:hypothetical protein